MLSLVESHAEKLRAVGVLRLRLGDLELVLAPRDAPAPKEEPKPDNRPPDPLSDPDTFGGRVPGFNLDELSK